MDLRLVSIQQHFDDLYSLRNYFVNGSFPERVVHMNRRIGRLADAERKHKTMEGSLARAFSYFMSTVNFFGGKVNLNRGMIHKFPSYGCSYCHKKPCDCRPEVRPDPKPLKAPDLVQQNWSIKDWQQHLDAVYGQANRQRGFWEVQGRLTSEFAELGILQVHGLNTPITPANLLMETECEAADVFSWLLAIAYIKDTDLEKEVLQRYTVCPGCGQKPCNCPIVTISPDGNFFSTVRTSTLKTP